MNIILRKIKEYEISINRTIPKAIFFSIIEIHIINVTVNYFIYNTFDIFNIKTIIPSLFYGILLGVVSYYVVRRMLSKNNKNNSIEL